ncbi:MAG: hypothetical protein WCQ95_01425 [Bacteroidota bacterium]
MLKPEIINEMRRKPELRRAIIDANRMWSEKTYYNWLRKNDERLTTFKNLCIISMYLKKPVAALTEPLIEGITPFV